MTQVRQLMSAEKRAFVFALLLMAATLALYHQVQHLQFIEDFDDGHYVTQNFHIKYGLDWQTVKWAFTAYYAGNWHPLTWLSHAWDCQLYFLDSGRHHDTNLLFHTLNAVLLFWVLWRATGWLGRSLMVAALFAWHPINVESVAWVAERKNVLSMFFFLLALGAYRWYACKPRVDRYIVVALLYALGLMAKPQIIAFPFILLLWDYWPLGRMFAAATTQAADATAENLPPPRSFAALLLEKIPLLLLSAASAVLTIKAQRAGGAMSGVMNSYPLPLRLENVVVAYARYVAKAFWPAHLSPLYLFPAGSWETWRVLTSCVFLLAVTVLVIRARQQARYLLVGWLWFLGALVPVIGLVQVGSQAMADRYAYVSFVGLFIMICWGVSDWAGRVHVATPQLAVPCLVILLILGTLTYRQIGYWQNSLTLWAHAAQATRNNWEAEDKWGTALVNSGDEAQSEVHFQAAYALNPLDPLANVHMGYVEQQRGNLPLAIVYYQRALSLTQNDVPTYGLLRDDALNNMAIAYRKLGDFTRATECLEELQAQRRQYRH